MATFKKIYSVSALCKMVENSTIIPYCWRDDYDVPQFFFVDARRCPSYVSPEKICFCSHKSNFYRFKKKINSLPFLLHKSQNCANFIHYTLEVRSLIFGNPFYYDPVTELKRLLKDYSSDYKVYVNVL